MNEGSLDCKGLRCPMPIVRLSQAIRKMENGDRLRIEATDSAFQPDLLAWAKQSGNQVLDFEFMPDQVQQALVEKGMGTSG